eukprot:163135_1
MYLNFLILFITFFVFTIQSESIPETICVTSTKGLFNGEYTYNETIGGTLFYEQTLGKYCYPNSCNVCTDGKIYIKKAGSRYYVTYAKTTTGCIFDTRGSNINIIDGACPVVECDRISIEVNSSSTFDILWDGEFDKISDNVYWKADEYRNFYWIYNNKYQKWQKK